jgi:NAD(P)-dependent dehydrogenase (short-subunit alcohol dehydrogenase family)
MIIPALNEGNVAVITGGASGIGLAAGTRLEAMGLRVCLIDLEQSALDAAAASISGNVWTYAADVSDRAAMDALAVRIRAEIGPVSVLMNNAGIGGGGDVLSNPDGWARLFGVNLFGVLNGVQAFVPAMVAGDTPGLVINTGSKQGITQPPGDTAYNATKSAVKALTEGLAHTLRQQTGGRVTAHLLIPGFTYTGMTARRLAEPPPGAWTPDQVVDFMLHALRTGDFYILCADNETTRAQDEKRIAWAAGDIIENRPALSRWHPEWEGAFRIWMEAAKN